jgi:hypothetical protein
MNATEEAGKVATGTVEALKTQPLALALVVVNVLFLIAGSYFLHFLAQTAADATTRKDAQITNLLEKCFAREESKP